MAKLQSVNSVAGKETLYVDVDDEITAIIDKVGSAKGKIVALVLPKRCPVLQSVVNMKLLKRTADKVGKNVVLVTSEPGLLPLAGATGLYVASTPSSKPVLPDAPSSASDDGPEELDEPLNIVDGNTDSDGEFDTKAAADKSVGELAAAGAAAKATKEADIDDSIDMNDPADTAKVQEDAKTDKTAKTKTPKPKKDKKLNVPNFDKFKKRLILGILALILLGALWYVAFKVLPSASITIGTDSSTIPTNLTLTLSTTANSLDTTNDIVPSTVQSQQKTNTATVQATGQQNNGQKASGTVTMSAGACSANTPNDIPAGTTLAANNVTFVLNSDVTFTASIHGHSCTFVGQDDTGDSNISITALNGGSNGNVSSASFTVTGDSGISANGSTSGGTDNITTVVQQSDITNATNKASSAGTSSIKQELEQSLQARGLMPIPVTFLAGSPQVSTNAQVGAAASSVTASAVTSYSMMGVQKSDLKTLVDNNVDGQLDKGKQVILDDGLSSAQFAEANPGNTSSATVAMTTNSLAGPQINTSSLKAQLAGMKTADIQSYIKQTPGVTNVNVNFSPFWVYSVPNNASKVKITIEKAGS